LNRVAGARARVDEHDLLAGVHALLHFVGLDAARDGGVDLRLRRL
jgi:hypothetical protein